MCLQYVLIPNLSRATLKFDLFSMINCVQMVELSHVQFNFLDEKDPEFDIFYFCLLAGQRYVFSDLACKYSVNKLDRHRPILKNYHKKISLCYSKYCV